ncbi:MAG: flagellar basal body-associated protein FliL [Rhizobiales bacterium]|nr:flagellar basal body-associated protein FliL [Hyphomicrobiales bacterium]
MAEENKDADAEAPAEAPKSKKKLIIIAAAAVLAVAAGGGGAWWFFIKKKDDAEQATAHASPKKIAFVELKDMMINLSRVQGSDRQNFLKLKVALEVADPKIVPEIQPLLPRIEDAFQVYVRELRPNELEGSPAVVRLREELLKRVNIAVYPAKVDAVLFKEILMQ